MDQLIKSTMEEADQKINHKTSLARYFARYQCIRRGQSLTAEEMTHIIDQLFACRDSQWSLFKKKCYSKFELNEIEIRLK